MGLRIANVLTDGDALSAAAAGAYLWHNGVDALVWYPYGDCSGAHGYIGWVGGKPIIGVRFSLWGDGTQGALGGGGAGTSWRHVATRTRDETATVTVALARSPVGPSLSLAQARPS